MTDNTEEGRVIMGMHTEFEAALEILNLRINKLHTFRTLLDSVFEAYDNLRIKLDALETQSDNSSSSPDCVNWSLPGVIIPPQPTESADLSENKIGDILNVCDKDIAVATYDSEHYLPEIKIGDKLTSCDRNIQILAYDQEMDLYACDVFNLSGNLLVEDRSFDGDFIRTCFCKIG